MMIMSHYGILVVIYVRLYDIQDELKTGARKKTCPEFYFIYPYMPSNCKLHCTRDQDVGYHEKYMNVGKTGVFKNSVCSSAHPHENSCPTSVYIEKQKQLTYPIKINHVTYIIKVYQCTFLCKLRHAKFINSFILIL